MNAAIFHRRSTRLSTGWTRKKNPGTIKNAACVTDKPTRVVRFFSAPPRITHAADDSIFRAKCFFPRNVFLKRRSNEHGDRSSFLGFDDEIWDFFVHPAVSQAGASASSITRRYTN